MKCDKSSEISAYLKGETPQGEREALRAHFEQCAACTQDLGKFDRLLKALGKMPDLDPSPGFKWRVREAFLRAHPEFLEAPRQVEPPGGWWKAAFGSVPAWAISIAAHVLLLALAAIIIFVPKSPEEEFADTAFRAKPREPKGATPVFAPPQGGPPAPRGAIGYSAPSEPPVEYTPDRRGSDPNLAPSSSRRNPNFEKLNLDKWNERLPRERRLLAFLEGRLQESQRADMRAAYGAQDTEKAVRAALDWLSRNQQPDGRWTGPALQSNEGEYSYSVGLTGLALLAFFAEGHTWKGGDYAATVRKGVDHLLSEQRASGLVGSDRGNSMYNHGVAALALLEASMMVRDENLLAAASAAAAYTVAAQNEAGGWGYHSRSPESDTSVSGWQILLLRLAKLQGNAGVIPSLNQAYNRLSLMTDSEGKVGYRARLQFPNGYLALTAVGMLSHQMSTHTPDREVLAKQSEVLLEQSPILSFDRGGVLLNDLYFGYFGSLAMHQFGGERWALWFSPLRGKLLRAQQQDGSWPADFDRWATKYGGQVYTTAMGALILETPLRYPRLD